jgi:hypothetical protein
MVAVTHTTFLTTQQSCINLQDGNYVFRTIHRTSSDHFLEEHKPVRRSNGGAVFSVEGK